MELAIPAVAESRDDGPRLRKVFHRVVEQTVAEPRAEDRGECSVNENRLETFAGSPSRLTKLSKNFAPIRMASAHISP